MSETAINTIFTVFVVTFVVTFVVALIVIVAVGTVCLVYYMVTGMIDKIQEREERE